MSHLLCWSATTGTRFQPTEAHGRPDTNGTLDDAENQNEYCDNYQVSSVLERINNGLAVVDDNYSTKPSRCDREAHKHTSLEFKQDH